MPTSIPTNLAEAFFDAVRAYIRWSFTAPEPNITADRELVPISTVCRRMEIFTDPLPDEVFNALYFLAADKAKRHLREKLNADRTHGNAAGCLLKMIEDRKAEWGEESLPTP
jgi:hypothetical protein